MATFERIGFGQVEPNQLSAIKTGQIYASLPLDPTVEILENGQFMFYNYSRNMVTAEKSLLSGNGDMTEPYLVYNEIKIYEDWLSYKDFAMIRVGDNYVTNKAMIGRLTSVNTDGTIYGGGSLTPGAPNTPSVIPPSSPYNPGDIGINPIHTEYPYRMDGIAPRLIKINVGDIFTTNTFMTGDDTGYVEGEIVVPTKVTYTGANNATYDVLELASVGAGNDQITAMQFAIVKKYTMPDGQTGFKVQRIA
jgi:hypothetical protein